MMHADVTASLTTYFKQCSMMVTAISLANLGAVLANNGIKPWDNKRLVPTEVATYTKYLCTIGTSDRTVSICADFPLFR